jgi:magnesium transporter
MTKHDADKQPQHAIDVEQPPLGINQAAGGARRKHHSARRRMVANGQHNTAHRRMPDSQHETGGTLGEVSEPGNPRQQLVVCNANGHFLTDLSPGQIDQYLAQPNDFVWLDIQNPEPHDLELLQEEFHFHPLAIEDATRRFERPKIDAYGNYYFLVFYAVRFSGEDAAATIQTDALHLFIGPNYLVSIHAAPMQEITATLDRWRHNANLFDNNVGALVYALLDAIVDNYFPVIDRLADEVDSLEEQMFSRFDPRVQQRIFVLKRNLLAMRRVVTPERDVLNVLIRREAPVFQQSAVAYLQDVYDHLMRVTDSIDTYRDILSSALDVYLSLQSNQLNQILKVLTVTSIVLMSAALIAGIYGMNFAYMPELNWRYGYPFALGLMALVAGGLLLLFRRLRWI